MGEACSLGGSWTLAEEDVWTGSRKLQWLCMDSQGFFFLMMPILYSERDSPIPVSCLSVCILKEISHSSIMSVCFGYFIFWSNSNIMPICFDNFKRFFPFWQFYTPKEVSHSTAMPVCRFVSIPQHSCLAECSWVGSLVCHWSVIWHNTLYSVPLVSDITYTLYSVPLKHLQAVVEDQTKIKMIKYQSDQICCDSYLFVCFVSMVGILQRDMFESWSEIMRCCDSLFVVG